MSAEAKYETKGDPDDDSLGPSSDESDDSSSVEEGELGLTENQKRLLYFISLHSHPAETEGEKEEWIRKQSMLVLIYEAIVEEVLDYDYAPASMMVESRRMYFNQSQEGASDLAFLVEEELVNALRITTKDHRPVMMYQISIKGLEVVRQIPRYDRDQVHRVAYSPDRALLRIEWDGTDYWMQAYSSTARKEAFRKKSSVLATEEVSYVSSAYIPACLRMGGRPTLSNAHRAGECADSAGTLRDELDEVITLNSVSIIVAEFIPFGANLMVELNHNMGSVERVQGGFFTAAIQDNNATEFKMDPGLTAVQILDYAVTGHLNLEADIRLPEEEGIVQVETFGISMHAHGTCFYGLQLEAVMNRVKDSISLDHLSRLLADVQTDSSEVVEAFLSPAQRRMLELVFDGDAAARNKVNMLVANEITPHLTAEEYLDKGEYENELKQVVGDTRAAFDITQYDTLVFGASGLLLAGPNSRTYEPLLTSYLQLISMDLFVRNYFNRCTTVIDQIRKFHTQLDEARHLPIPMREALYKVPKLGAETAQLAKILSYLEEALVIMEIPPPPSIAAGRALYDRLATPRLQAEMARRVTDLAKTVREMQADMEAFKVHASFIAGETDRDLARVRTQQAVETVEIARTDRKRTHTLQMIMVLLSGSFMFDLMDRLTGQWTVMETTWFSSFADTFVTGNGGLWFFLSVIFWLLMAYFSYWLTRKALRNSTYNMEIVRLELQTKLSLGRLQNYLDTKRLKTHRWEVTTIGDMVSASWEEFDRTKWGGVIPTIRLDWSAHTQMLWYVTAEYPANEGKKRTAFTPSELRERIVDDLRYYQVIKPDDPDAPQLIMGALDTDKKMEAGSTLKKQDQLREAS